MKPLSKNMAISLNKAYIYLIPILDTKVLDLVKVL